MKQLHNLRHKQVGAILVMLLNKRSCLRMITCHHIVLYQLHTTGSSIQEAKEG